MNQLAIKYDVALNPFEQWQKFHHENPGVWTLFERFALEAIRAGRKHYSHWAIMQRVRWESEIVTKGDPFKINNNHLAFYARLFGEVHPQYKGFFHLRAMKNDHFGEMP